MGKKSNLSRKRKYGNRKPLVDRIKRNTEKILDVIDKCDTTNFASMESVTTNFENTDDGTINVAKMNCDILNKGTPTKSITIGGLPKNSPVAVTDTGEFEEKNRERKKLGPYTESALVFEDKQTNQTWEEQQYRRSAIAFVFTNHLFCPPKHEWKGKDGSIMRACQFLELDFYSSRHVVQKVFEIVEYNMIPYRKVRCLNKNLLIPPGSLEE